jgi:hypothetical protein
LLPEKKTMCEAALQNYTSFINNQADVTQDNIPTILFFKSTNCTSQFFPVDTKTGNFTAGSYPIGARFELPFSPEAFYIPFNIQEVVFFGLDSSSSFLGPVLIPDTSLVNWQNGSTSSNMRDVAIQAIEIVSVRDWNEQVVEMCMGQQHILAGYSLSRYLPGSQRCDYFMQNQFCQGGTLLTDPACGCFADLVDVKAMSAELGVDLPVLCFGKSCATERTYKSNSIKSKPCNMTICQQAVQLSAGVSGSANAHVFCGGHFFDNKGSLVPVSVSPIADYTAAAPPTDSPWFVGVIIAVSVVLFALLAFLMFNDAKKKPVVKAPEVIEMSEIPSKIDYSSFQ